MMVKLLTTLKIDSIRNGFANINILKYIILKKKLKLQYNII